MSTDLQPTTPLDPAIVQEVLIGGDLAKLTPQQRITYYLRVCDSVGLNPYTQPFAFIVLNKKLVLYALKACTDQLRFIHRVSIDPAKFTREVIEGIYVVTAAAKLPGRGGRTDVATGAVPIDGLRGDDRANAMMRAETKAKRRVTLSICGLGMLDETEVDTIGSAGPVSPPPFVADIPPDEVDPPADSVYIRSIDLRSKTGKDGREYRWSDVILSTGEVAVCWDERLTTILQQRSQDHIPVRLVLGKTSKGNTEIIEVHTPTPDPPAEPVPVAAGDIVL